VLAPAVWGLAAGEILALAGRTHEEVGLERIAARAHQDRSISLRHDIVHQHQPDRALDAAVDVLGQLGPGLLGDLGHDFTKGVAIGGGGHYCTPSSLAHARFA
jgi:hypothetical protein